MAQNKTQPTSVDPVEYIAAIEHDTRRADAEVLLEMMQRLSGHAPVMWGPTIIGFGNYHYVYESGHEGDTMLIGFAPRKANQVLYVLPGYDDLGDKLDALGKHRIGKSCLYINKLADVDLDVLESIIVDTLKVMNERAKRTSS